MLPLTVFKLLEEGDIKILKSLERGMSRFEYIPIDYMVRRVKIEASLLSRHLGKLCRLGLVRRSFGAYEGYSLTRWGYDCLALSYLVSNNIIEAIGKPLGVGKEADVYDAITPFGERIAVKFHRLGRTSFKKTRRVRTYVADGDKVSWLLQSRTAAKREFEALKILYPKGVSVPKAKAWNRHVIVMSYIEGDPLYVCDFLPDARSFLSDILSNVRRSYREAGVVHGDLSEYNIIVTPEIKPLIIDWPQFVFTSHPSALMLLERDILNLLRFFKRRFMVEVDFKSVFEYIIGE